MLDTLSAFVPKNCPEPTVRNSRIVTPLTVGATAVVLGIGLCLLQLPDLGATLIVVGLLQMVWELHRLGRAGTQ